MDTELVEAAWTLFWMIVPWALMPWALLRLARWMDDIGAEHDLKTTIEGYTKEWSEHAKSVKWWVLREPHMKGEKDRRV